MRAEKLTRRAPDNGLRGVIRGHLRGMGKWDSIETGSTEQGVPDLHVMIRQGREAWIECKHTDGNAVTFRPGQVGWLFTHWRYGGTAFIFTQRQTKWKQKDRVDELYITSAQHVRELEVLGLDGTQHVARFDGGNRGWDWTMIEEILRGTALADALDLAPAPKVPSYAKLRGRKAELARALLTGPSARDRNAG
jgi:hypothetical protein